MPHHLPATWIAHLDAGLAYRIGACTPEGEPRLMRAVGARVDDDGVFELLVPRRPAAEVLAAVVATGRVAVTAGYPLNNRTLHVKGQDAVVVDARPEHGPLLRAQRDAFGRAVALFGVDLAQLDRLWFRVDWNDLACVRFHPCGAWDQTPGIGAGGAIELLTMAAPRGAS